MAGNAPDEARGCSHTRHRHLSLQLPTAHCQPASGIRGRAGFWFVVSHSRLPLHCSFSASVERPVSNVNLSFVTVYCAGVSPLLCKPGPASNAFGAVGVLGVAGVNYLYPVPGLALHGVDCTDKSSTARRIERVFFCSHQSNPRSGALGYGDFTSQKSPQHPLAPLCALCASSEALRSGREVFSISNHPSPRRQLHGLARHWLPS